MATNSFSKRLALINTLLRPIQKTIRELLPDFADRNLKSKTIRAAIVSAADAALVRQFPIARIFPRETRQRLIRKQLDVVLDEFTFELTTEHAQLSVRDAWELAYRLQEEPGIAHAEPNLIVPLENVAPDEGPAIQTKSFFGKKPLDGSKPPEWSLDNINVKQA